MKIDIITLFPEMFSGPFSESIIKRAKQKDLVNIDIHQLRDFTADKHKTVDEKPYGGGPGMIMRVDVAFAALKVWLQKNPNDQIPMTNKIQNSKSKKSLATSYQLPTTILLTPKGKKFNQAMAQKLSKKSHLVFLCPHYEGYDHRIESLVDEKISIGDYILTGGEIPAMVIVDSVVRLVPGAIKAESLREESFSKISNSKIIISNKMSKSKLKNPIPNTLNPKPYFEYPQYTRPEIFEIEVKDAIHPGRTRKIKKRVPKVLLSGNHALIAKWRERNS